MSMFGGRAAMSAGDVGQTVAGYSTYEAAQKAVSTLIGAEIPARHIAIVGSGLRSVERVTGRLGYATAARSGAVNGLLLGLLFAAVLVIGSPTLPIPVFVGVLFVGIALGMLLSLTTYSLVRKRRDYASVIQVVADHYDVTVPASDLARARAALGVGAAAPAGLRPTEDSEPPRYGERVTPSASESTDAEADDDRA